MRFNDVQFELDHPAIKAVLWVDIFQVKSLFQDSLHSGRVFSQYCRQAHKEASSGIRPQWTWTELPLGNWLWSASRTWQLGEWGLWAWLCCWRHPTTVKRVCIEFRFALCWLILSSFVREAGQVTTSCYLYPLKQSRGACCRAGWKRDVVLMSGDFRCAVQVRGT